VCASSPPPPSACFRSSAWQLSCLSFGGGGGVSLLFTLADILSPPCWRCLVAQPVLVALAVAHMGDKVFASLSFFAGCSFPLLSLTHCGPAADPLLKGCQCCCCNAAAIWPLQKALEQQGLSLLSCLLPGACWLRAWMPASQLASWQASSQQQDQLLLKQLLATARVAVAG